MGIKIALVFSLILWKNPFENRIFKKKKPLIIWIRLPPDSYISSLNVKVLGFCFEILMLITLSSVRAWLIISNCILFIG